MKIEFHWQDPDSLLKEVTRALRAQGVKLQRIPEMAVRRGAFELQARIQANVPKKTGTLVRNIGVRIERAAGGVVIASVGTHMQYAPFIEYGTGLFGPMKREILITAKSKKGLFWGAYDRDGRPIVRRSVRIRGMKPRAPFGQAVRDFLPRYQEIIRQELEREAQR